MVKKGRSAYDGLGVRPVDSTEERDGQPSRRGDPASRSTSGWFWTATMAVSLLVLVVAVAGVKAWADLRSSQVRVDELRREAAEVGRSVERLRSRLEEFAVNPELRERVAREELGVVRPDEVVVILPESP